MTEYPEHAKLDEMMPAGEVIEAFLAWLDDVGVTLCAWDNEMHRFVESGLSREFMIADPLGADTFGLEGEREAMAKKIEELQGLKRRHEL